MFSILTVLVGVLPAHAGVIRKNSTGRRNVRRAPRACGGDPQEWLSIEMPTQCSPRMRG